MTKNILFYENMSEIKAGTVVNTNEGFGIILSILSIGYRSIKWVSTFKQACDVAYCLKAGARLTPSYSAINLMDYIDSERNIVTYYK